MKVIVSGSTGRIGQELIRIIKNQPKWHLVGLINRKGFSPTGDAYTALGAAQAQADVVVDFSLPANMQALTQFCSLNKLPLVSGTTGLAQKHFEAFDNLALKVPVLWTPNMSLGIYFLHRLVQQLKVLTPGFKASIEETHHIHKKDSPSGTALLLQQAVYKSTGQECPVQAHRKSDVFGVHKIKLTSKSEQLVFSHEALNRSVFAHGALQAASVLYKKKAQRYTLQDVLNKKC